MHLAGSALAPQVCFAAIELLRRLFGTDVGTAALNAWTLDDVDYPERDDGQDGVDDGTWQIDKAVS